MSTPDESGTAFPETRPGGYGTTAGLSKREWFAGMAMIAAYRSWMAECRDTNVSSAHMAQECYLIADAILKAGAQ